MNFEEWYNKRANGMVGGDGWAIAAWKNTANQGWDACKQEVLRILNDNRRTAANSSNFNDDEDIENDFIRLEAIEEIEKL